MGDSWHYCTKEVSCDSVYISCLKQMCKDKSYCLPRAGGLAGEVTANGYKCLGADVYSITLTAEKPLMRLK